MQMWASALQRSEQQRPVNLLGRYERDGQDQKRAAGFKRESRPGVCITHLIHPSTHRKASPCTSLVLRYRTGALQWVPKT